MTKTVLQNKTGTVVDLKEGNVGILRRSLCQIEPDKDYSVHSQLNQTYKEYWCVSNNSNQFQLSSDDLSEWKVIVIKPTVDDPSKFYWEGTTARKPSGGKTKAANAIPPAQPAAPPPPLPPPAPSSSSSSSWFKSLSNKAVGLFHKQKSAGITPATTSSPTILPASAARISGTTVP